MIHDLREKLVELTAWAEANQSGCLRKSVGCAILIWNGQTYDEVVRATNGPTPNYKCTGERGNCGCAHAEPRAVMALMNLLDRQSKFLLLCNYSPCTRCAQVIVDAHNLFGVIDAVAFKHVTEHDTRGLEILKLAGLEIIEL